LWPIGPVEKLYSVKPQKQVVTLKGGDKIRGGDDL
jgi:hypothetical protein